MMQSPVPCCDKSLRSLLRERQECPGTRKSTAVPGPGPKPPTRDHSAMSVVPYTPSVGNKGRLQLIRSGCGRDALLLRLFSAHPSVLSVDRGSVQPSFRSPPHQVLTTFFNLSVLYLHGNSIQRLGEVNKLAVLPRLRSLTLHGNPIEEEKGYR